MPSMGCEDRLVVIQAVGLPGVQALLPGALKLDYVGRVHIRRNPLQDRETELDWIDLPGFFGPVAIGEQRRCEQLSLA